MLYLILLSQVRLKLVHDIHLRTHTPSHSSSRDMTLVQTMENNINENNSILILYVIKSGKDQTGSYKYSPENTRSISYSQSGDGSFVETVENNVNENNGILISHVILLGQARLKLVHNIHLRTHARPPTASLVMALSLKQWKITLTRTMTF